MHHRTLEMDSHRAGAISRLQAPKPSLQGGDALTQVVLRLLGLPHPLTQVLL